MPDNKPEAETAETGKCCLEIKDLPQTERELTPEEEKEVKGGGFINSATGERSLPNDPNP